MDNRLLDIIHAKVCNEEYYVIQNPLLITRVMQPICDILGVEVPTMRDLQNIFDQVDRKCGSCYSSDGCRPQFLVGLMREYAAHERSVQERRQAEAAHITGLGYRLGYGRSDITEPNQEVDHEDDQEEDEDGEEEEVEEHELADGKAND